MSSGSSNSSGLTSVCFHSASIEVNLAEKRSLDVSQRFTEWFVRNRDIELNAEGKLRVREIAPGKFGDVAQLDYSVMFSVAKGEVTSAQVHWLLNGIYTVIHELLSRLTESGLDGELFYHAEQLLDRATANPRRAYVLNFKVEVERYVAPKPVQANPALDVRDVVNQESATVTVIVQSTGEILPWSPNAIAGFRKPGIA